MSPSESQLYSNLIMKERRVLSKPLWTLWVGKRLQAETNRRGEGRRGKEREGLPPPCKEGTKKEPSPCGVCVHVHVRALEPQIGRQGDGGKSRGSQAPLFPFEF